MTIALVEDDTAILRSLSMLLEGRGITVHGYQSAELFLAAVGDAPVECVVTDIRMPGMSGLELQKELKRRDPAIPVILITGHGDVRMAVRAIKEGAFDFIEKPFHDDQLLESITLAIESRRRQRVETDERAAIEARIAELSRRQIEVMNLVVQGFSNKEIALKLDISPRTVENYRAWVMEKMGATNLADLVRKVLVLER